MAAADTTRLRFSTPRQSFSAPRQSFQHAASRRDASVSAVVAAECGANRAAITPGSRPGIGERPGIANTPNWDNRLNAANRPGIDNRANLGNRAYVANRPNIGNNFNHQPDEQLRPADAWRLEPRRLVSRRLARQLEQLLDIIGRWVGGRPAYWAGDAISAIPWSWGYWPYYNPYYGGSYVAGSALRLLATDRGGPGGCLAARRPAGLTAEQQATPLFDAARNAFMQGDYTTALAQVDQAIAQVPNDTVLHEFRGLALFALGRYKEAAAADYAVLSAGPGWDWTTLSALYPNVDVYTAQLRALEQYAKSHPAASDAKFLLAENYLTCGYTDAAAVQLKEVVQLDPKDQLSAQLLNSISTSNTAQPAVSEPAGGACEAGRCVEPRGQLDRDACG